MQLVENRKTGQVARSVRERHRRPVKLDKIFSRDHEIVVYVAVSFITHKKKDSLRIIIILHVRSWCHALSASRLGGAEKSFGMDVSKVLVS